MCNIYSKQPFRPSELHHRQQYEGMIMKKQSEGRNCYNLTG